MKLKGGIEDVLTIAFVLLLLGILGVIGFFFMDAVMTQIDSFNFPGLPPTYHKQATDTFQFMDGVIGLVLALLVGGSLALAFYSRAHPFLAVISVFVQIFFLIGSYFIKLFWQGFSNATPALNTVAITNFPITNLILTYLPFISFILLIGTIVLSFTKPREEYAVGV